MNQLKSLSKTLIGRALCLSLVILPFLGLGCQPISSTSPVEKLPEMRTNSLGMKLLLLPSGRFMMGSPTTELQRKFNERLHPVTLSHPFYMGAYEVTQKEWKHVMGNEPSFFKGENLPVETVSWNEAQLFCQRLTQQERSSGHISGSCRYRLPTEAEREYACRAGTTTTFNTGMTLDATQANINGETPYPGTKTSLFRKRTLPVGSFPPNAWGLYDMHGNVYEWCQDYWSGYPEGEITDPFPTTPHKRRVYRGGAWKFPAAAARSAKRSQRDPAKKFDFMGLRLVLEVKGTDDSKQ